MRSFKAPIAQMNFAPDESHNRCTTQLCCAPAQGGTAALRAAHWPAPMTPGHPPAHTAAPCSNRSSIACLWGGGDREVGQPDAKRRSIHWANEVARRHLMPACITRSRGLPVGVREAERHGNAVVQPGAKLASHVVGTWFSKQSHSGAGRLRSGAAGGGSGALELAAGS